MYTCTESGKHPVRAASMSSSLWAGKSNLKGPGLEPSAQTMRNASSSSSPWARHAWYHHAFTGKRFPCRQHTDLADIIGFSIDTTSLLSIWRRGKLWAANTCCLFLASAWRMLTVNSLGGRRHWQSLLILPSWCLMACSHPALVEFQAGWTAISSEQRHTQTCEAKTGKKSPASGWHRAAWGRGSSKAKDSPFHGNLMDGISPVITGVIINQK